MKIESGTGNGYYAKVTADNAVVTAAITLPRQHFVAKTQQGAYQVIGEATPVNGTTNVLHLKNDTPDKTFTITYLRLAQIDLAGGTAIPNASNYFQIGGGLSYSSGGSGTESVNTFIGSPAVSGGTFYEANPTLTGTINVLDKHWARTDGEEWSYTKDGSLVIPPGSTLTVQYVGDHTAGNLYTRVSFYVTDVNSLTV